VNKNVKIQQKKLYSRVFSKSYLHNLLDVSMNHLKQRGFFSNSNDEQYYNILLKDVYTQSDHIVKSDYVVYNQLNSELTNDYMNGMINQHRQSLINERKRKENESRLKREEEEVIRILK
jgi:hypothetical protein